MLRKRLTLLILLSMPVFICVLYFFISESFEEPEIQIEYVLPNEPIKDDAKGHFRHYATHVQTKEKRELHILSEKQHVPPIDRQPNKQNSNTSLAEAENHSLNKDILDKSVQEAVVLEEKIAKLSQDRKSVIATLENVSNAILENWDRQVELKMQDEDLGFAGFDENSPSRAAVMQEFSEISRKLEQLDMQKEELAPRLKAINQELPALQAQLRAMHAANWDVDNTDF